MIVVALQFFLGELLVAVSLCEVLGLVVRDGMLLADCLFDELEELLICHHLVYSIWKNSRKSSRCIAL